MMRRLAVATVLAALVPAASASAHAMLMRAAPRASQALSAAPGGVALRFDEPVSVPRNAVRVIGADNRDVATDIPVSGMAAVVRARVPRRLAAGKYTVRWHVVADDGHPVSGSYRFKVRPGAGTASAAMPSMGGAGHTGGGAPPTQTILLIAALAAIAIVALRGSPLGGREAGEVRAAVTVDAALIAVGAFCALALIGVVAANQDSGGGGGEQVAAATAPAASPAAAPTHLSSP
jgi:copper transport protein